MTDTTAILALGLPSTLAALAVLVLLGLASAAWTIDHDKIATLAVITTCLQSLSLGAFIALLWSKTHFTRSRFFDLASPWRDIYLLLSMSLACLAGVASLAIIVWMQCDGPNTLGRVFSSPPQFLLIGLVVSWVLSTVGQATTFALLILRKGQSRPALSTRSMDSHEGISFNTSKSAEGTIIETPLSSIATAASTPPLSPTSASLCSLQSAARFPSGTASVKVYGCKSSRPPSGCTDFSEPESLNSVAGSSHNVSHSNLRPIAPLLPTIPGSRPVSPARALDGPFAVPEKQAQANLLPLQPETPIVIAPPETSPSHVAVPLTPPEPLYLVAAPRPSMATRYSFESDGNAFDAPTPMYQHSHSASSTSLAESVSHLRRPTATEEDDIHPLFRTTSPTPPPTASQGTIVHAASITEAEEAVTSGTGTARRRASSRVGSPLSRPATATAEPPSIPRVMTGELHLKLQGSRSKSQDSSPQGSPSDENERRQLGKKSTTESPRSETSDDQADDKIIPSFVLAAGQRSSFLGFETRRASQRHKKDGAHADENHPAGTS